MTAIAQYKNFKQLLDVNWPAIADGQILTRSGATVAGIATPVNRGIINEVHIAFRADSLTGSGTTEDPLNGKSQALLDALWPTIPTNTRIILRAPPTGSQFITNGSIITKEGWRIVGQGKDLTTLKLANGVANTSGNNVWFFTDVGRLNYCEFSDLTLDCNAANQGIATGSLNGFLNAIGVRTLNGMMTRIKSIGAYAKSAEGFPLHFETDNSAGTHYEISNCEVLSSVGNMSAISLINPTSGGQATGFIELCNVSGNVLAVAYGAGGWTNSSSYFKIRNNRCSGVATGIIMDTGDFYNTEISGNDFIVVGGVGIGWAGVGTYNNFRIHDNHIVTAGFGNLISGTTNATALQSIYDNRLEAPGSTAVLLLAGKGTLRNNIITESSSSTIPAGFKHTGNIDATGALLYGETV